MRKRGQKRNRHQKARDIKQESMLRAEGKTLREISDAVGVSHEQVRADLKHIDQRLIEAATKDLEKAKAENLAKIRFAQSELAQAWLNSMNDSSKISTKQSSDGTEITTVTEAQTGNPGHMRNYIKALEAEAKLLGLYEIGTGKGDEAAQRLIELHAQLEMARKLYDSESPPTSKP